MSESDNQRLLRMLADRELQVARLERDLAEAREIQLRLAERILAAHEVLARRAEKKGVV